MKKLILPFAITLFLVGCGNHKDSVQEATEVVTETTENVSENSEEIIEEIEEKTRIIGIVHISETDCPLYIEATEMDKTLNLYPINLDEKYKVEGMKLKFYYEISKAQQPENCLVDFPASLSDVTIMR